TATITITVSHVNHAPVAKNDTFTLLENSPAVSLNVLANDSDIDHDTLTIAHVGMAMHGTTSINATNTRILYTPDANYSGNDLFNYTITDGHLIATAYVNMNISHVNHAPAAHNDSMTLDENTNK